MATKDLLHELFEYKDGILYSKVARYKTSIKKGDVVGFISNKGYLRTCINYKSYKLHRLIFMMFYGYMPREIDHINGNKTDNRIENLREVNHSQNQWNRPKTSRNTTGKKGITFEYGKWRVRVGANNKTINVGVFDNLELAELVAIEARNKFHGNFAKH
jgi:hypothetical protein